MLRLISGLAKTCSTNLKESSAEASIAAFRMKILFVLRQFIHWCRDPAHFASVKSGERRRDAASK